VEGVALITVGLILMIVGALGFVVSLLYMFVWAHRGPYEGPPRGPYERPPPPRTDLRPAGPHERLRAPHRYAHP
jgi:hypothetical protein